MFEYVIQVAGPDFACFLAMETIVGPTRKLRSYVRFFKI